MGALRAWIATLRPATLLLAWGAAALTAYLAAADGRLHWGVFIAYALTITLLQALSNVANDLGDAEHGADAQRVGPVRPIHQGVLTVRHLRKAVHYLRIAAFLSGTAAVLLSPADPLAKGILWVAGLAAVWAATAYTRGRNPYGYRGWGDLMVWLFFGVAAVGMGYWLVTGRLQPAHFLIAAAYGLLNVAVLNLNNLRDLDTDRAAGKRTLATRLGKKGTIAYHLALFAAAVALHALWGRFVYHSPRQYYSLFYGLIFFYHWGFVARARTPQRLIFMLKQLVLTTFIYAHVVGLSLWVK